MGLKEKDGKKLQEAVKAKLRESNLDGLNEEMISEYVLMMIVNEKSMDQIKQELIDGTLIWLM
jgi:hypothetical protein